MSDANRNAIKGAFGGAIAGAGISQATGGEHTGRDAIIGAIAGASIGAYMDKQASQLQQQLNGTGVSVVKNTQTGNIDVVMPGNVTFAYDDARLHPSFTPALDRIAATLIEYGDTQIYITGHTDSTGSDTYNQTLSQSRADAVANYLKSRGVPVYRIDSQGFGETRPIASNDTEAGRAQNRRVEMMIHSVR